jgi:hypothetical protein
MLVNAKQHFPAPSAAFRRPLHSFSKLIVKNNVLCFDPTPYIFRPWVPNLRSILYGTKTFLKNDREIYV